MTDYRLWPAAEELSRHPALERPEARQSLPHRATSRFAVGERGRARVHRIMAKHEGMRVGHRRAQHEFSVNIRVHADWRIRCVEDCEFDAQGGARDTQRAGADRNPEYAVPRGRAIGETRVRMIFSKAECSAMSPLNRACR